MKFGKSARYVFVIAVCCALVFCLAFFTACGENCGGDPADNPGETTLERIEVTKKPTKTEYFVGDNFSRAGMVVTAYYSDGTNAPVMGYSVDKSGSLTAADTRVTVTYKEKSDSFDIIVKEKEIVTQLEINSTETRTYKVEAENCELATGDIGSHIEYHDAANGNPATSGGESLGLLNGTNNRITMRIKSDVEADISLALSMSFNPSLDFDANVTTEWNSEVITTGFTVVYNEGFPYAWFDWHEYTIEGLRLKAGINVLDLTILHLSANYDYFKINVNPIKSTLTSISVTAPPTKTVYSEGEFFDPAGMVVTASYDDGMTAIVDDYTVDKTKLAMGDTEVTITYKGCTATVPVTVNPRTATLSGITVTSPIKISYVAGDYFRTAGMTVTATYGDNTTEMITDYTVDKTGPLTLADTVVTVGYGGKTATVDITVSEGDGAKHAVIANGNTASYRVEAEDSYIYKNRDADSWRIEEHSATEGNPTTSGLKNVGFLNLTTTGISVIVDSAVEAPVSVTLRLAYNPSLEFDEKVATYWNGDKLTTGFTVAQTDSTYDWFDWHYFTIEGLTLHEGVNVLEFINLGDMTVSYDCFDINVNPITSTLTGISVTTPPTKIVYVEGESFDPAGMVVTATYDDGNTAPVADFTVDTTTPLAVGTISMTVSYNGKTATVPITVNPRTAALSGITVTSPIKTSYVAGDYFRAVGMVVTATYSDNTTEVITEYTVDKTGPLTLTDTVVTVGYGGKTATVDITVSEGDGMKHAAIANGNSASYRVEAENAYIYKNRDADSWQIEEHSATEGNPETSNGKSLGWLNMTQTGVKVIIESAVDAPVSVTLRLAYNPSLKFDEKVASYWNGEKLTTGFTVAYIEGFPYAWFDWHYFTIEDLNLREGVNILEFINLGDVTVSYDCFDINVNSIESLAITTPPSKTDYIMGETFDPAGMVITATYADGTTAPVTGFIVDTTTPLTSDATFVTVGYNGLTAEVAITVSEPAELARIEITTPPDKTIYYGGESFDPAGMVVTAYYGDDSSIELTNYTVDKTVMGLSDAFVTVSYGGKTATVDLTVKTHLTFTEAATYNAQFEDALFDKGTGDKDFYIVSDNDTASGGKFVDGVDWMPNATFTVTIDSKVEGTVSVSLFMSAPNYILDDNTDVIWNGETLTTGITVDSGWLNFTEFTSDGLSVLPLHKGLNIFTYRLVAVASSNLDYIAFTVNPTAE